MYTNCIMRTRRFNRLNKKTRKTKRNDESNKTQVIQETRQIGGDYKDYSQRSKMFAYCMAKIYNDMASEKITSLKESLETIFYIANVDLEFSNVYDIGGVENTIQSNNDVFMDPRLKITDSNTLDNYKENYKKWVNYFKDLKEKKLVMKQIKIEDLTRSLLFYPDQDDDKNITQGVELPDPLYGLMYVNKNLFDKAFGNKNVLNDFDNFESDDYEWLFIESYAGTKDEESYSNFQITYRNDYGEPKQFVVDSLNDYNGEIYNELFKVIYYFEMEQEDPKTFQCHVCLKNKPNDEEFVYVS